MNFAYNFLTSIAKLKTTLLSQFVDLEEDELEMEIREYSDDVTEERYFLEGSDQMLCRIVTGPKGIIYYE